ncbi:TetR family transcriptional regulator [Paracoccus aminophilus]|uniref:Transcriptional regulator, TetR family n=1 Tax=Paracoccus aminophilus JCM 7686 TaxID=1367847 RepID=S5Y0D1_PARAH|nr:TetR family transcriptional regulator [Paracoccus aminophilus]AGT10987.1 transcriptional regulator, TetR family [Paracoccus aminophilus JCM 7686]
MGRSSKEEAARTRLRILAAASDLFRKSGAERVSVADIMAAAGLTTGGFYKHFASKEALVAEATALAFAQSDEGWARLAAAQPEEGAGTAALRAALVRHYLRPTPEQRCPMIAFAAPGAEHSAPSEPASKDSGLAYRDGVAALLARFADPGTAANPARPEAPPPGESLSDEALVLFAAMIGARVLGEASASAPWIAPLRTAVIRAAEAEAVTEARVDAKAQE